MNYILPIDVAFLDRKEAAEREAKAALARHVVKSLRRWQQTPKLKRLIMTAIARRLTPEDTAEEVREAQMVLQASDGFQGVMKKGGFIWNTRSL